LREEGGFEFKKTIVNSIVTLIKAVPESAEISLLHLCEFIEDCEFTMLSTQILHLLGDIGPKTTAPARYIRFIYNRVLLENSSVRAAAITALSKFAASCPSLRASIMTLIKRGLVDEDDETRDRTVVAVNVLQDAMDNFPYVPPSDDEVVGEDELGDVPLPGDTAAAIILDGLPMSFDKLRRSLMVYESSPGSMDSNEPLTFSVLPVVEDEPEDVVRPDAAEESTDIDMIPDEQPEQEKVDPAAAVYAIPELAALGRVFRSSSSVPLTESETEYVVGCVKHVFEENIVLQFSVQNTIDDQRLENVTVMLESDGDLFEVIGEIPSTSIKYGETGHCFTVIQRNLDVPLEPTTFSCNLHFNVVQVDPASGEDESEAFEEEYPLEELEISPSDYMAKVTVPDFRKAWEAVGNENEVLEKYALQFKTVEDAVASIINKLGMQPCDGTATVKADGSGKPHMLHLSGVFIGGKATYARAQFASQGNTGVILKIAVRGEDSDIPRLIADCVQ
jgi:coatomer protein complex subunit gamma